MTKNNRKIGVIVTYTGKNQKINKYSALGWYSKNLYENMNLYNRENIIIFSDIKTKRNIFQEKDILINECWRRNNIFFWYEIIKEINHYNNLKIIHIQHEFNQFGGLITIPLSLILLFILKILLNKKIIVTFHGVIDQNIINKKFIKINNLYGPVFFIKFFFKIYYYIAHWFINTTIVHENVFKNILLKNYNYNKPIFVIPIGVNNKKINITKETSRKILNINHKYIILYFGFLAGYKGIDLLVDAFNLIDNDEYFLIIAGGKPARVENDKNYNLWFNKLEKKCKINPNIEMTGFVKEKDLDNYFIASDLTVFPYLLPLSASGVMAIAIANETPFIASDSFKGVVNERLIFKKNPQSLKNKILDFFKSDKTNLKNYILKLKKSRRWKNCAIKIEKAYLKLI